MMNGIHHHKCRACTVERECPQITHCKRPYEVDECFDCYANRIQAEAEARALEELREVAGMNCEQLPHEVREALHRIPDIGKTHQCELSDAPQ